MVNHDRLPFVIDPVIPLRAYQPMQISELDPVSEFWFAAHLGEERSPPTFLMRIKKSGSMGSKKLSNLK